MAFKLSEKFLEKFREKQPNWGYGALSYFTYKRTYSRMMDNGMQEEFFDTLKRVTEGTFRVQEKHCKSNGLPWNGYQAQKTAQEFFKRMWNFKFLPPGRGLWMMGTPLVDKIGSAALNNCGYTSTKDIDVDLASPFAWTMDMLMLGVGIGFDTKGDKKVIIKQPKKSKILYEIPDTREGWVESVRLLINSYSNGNYVEFNYDLIRKFGEPIHGFGGKASGPAPLLELHESIRKMFDASIGEPISSTQIVDIMNFIGKCVVSGNVRRSAELAIGEIDDIEYISMKDPSKHQEELLDRRWASNNSVFVKPDSDFSKVTDNIIMNGEPGLIFIENSKHYGRVKDGWHPFESERYDDVEGFNPCAEQSLEDKELCCLVETFPANHESNEDYLVTLKFAYLYAKTVTLIPTHEERTNAVVMRNRRIGCSMSGIQQAIRKFGHHNFMMDFCDEGYKIIKGWDRVYSRWLGVPRSVKMTTVKPSGCQRKDTLISTDKGMLTLEELGDINGKEWQEHDFTVSTDVGLAKSTKFYINGNVETKKITTSDGVELECSHNHQYRVVDKNGEYLWKRADELSVGDNLVVKLNSHFTENIPSLQELSEFEYSQNSTKIKTPKKMNEDLAWFIGLFYSDGSVHSKGIRISFNRKQPGLLDWIVSFAKNEFGIDAKIDDGHSLYLNSIPLKKWLEKNGILKELSGDISVPNIIRTSRAEIVKAFIDGFWRGDGGIHNLNTWTVCSISEKFAREFMQLCRGIGINVKISCAGPGGLGARDRWIVQSRTNSPSRYYSKEFKNRFWKDFWLDPIINIEDSMCDTYDIEVPEGNTYIANGTVSHNTVSILAGATPGIHFTHSEYYMRTVRCSAILDSVQKLREANYRVELDVTNKDIIQKTLKKLDMDPKKWKQHAKSRNLDDDFFEEYSKNGGSVVIYFPIKEKNFTKSKFESSIWEQVLSIREMQYYWSDNSVSCTITFNKEEAKDLQRVIEFVSPYVKTLSFLPLTDHRYEQAPYQECEKNDYESYLSELKEIDFSSNKEAEILGSKFCDGDSCEI